MHTDERDQQSRDDKDVQREEPRKRCAGNDRAAEHEVHSPRPITGRDLRLMPRCLVPNTRP